MKIILFLAAVYSLIINQCQQKTTHSSTPPASYISPAVQDSLVEASSITTPDNNRLPANKKAAFVSVNYTLTSSAFFVNY
jgi:hypothetical protein